MKTWEYSIVANGSLSREDFLALLNEKGAEGWEVVDLVQRLQEDPGQLIDTLREGDVWALLKRER